MYDILPATRPWLLLAAFQENTSLVMVSLNRRAMNSTAAIVSGELSTTRSLASWMDAPCVHMRPRRTMLESISWDMPRPICTPLDFLISAPPRSRSSHVAGPFGNPTGSQSDLR